MTQIIFKSFLFQSNLLFGWILYTYKTLQDSMLAIIALQLGIFNYEEVGDAFVQIVLTVR